MPDKQQDAAPQAKRSNSAWAAPEPLLCELSEDYTSSPLSVLPTVNKVSSDSLLVSFVPAQLLRSSPARIGRIAEADLARHFGRLARRNHNLHQGIYPLGSCTMKHNPAINEELSGLAGFSALHPMQPVEDAQGTLSILYELEQLLCEITGMVRFSLQPAAGAHGEWTGLRMIQAFHAKSGDMKRTVVLVPDSAHGTNPASAALCGMSVKTVASTASGTVDVEDLKAKLDETVAAIMLTNPNTLGVFENDIEQIAKLAHAAGALLYYDGANLNALVGICRPGEMGFDVVHLNLHKTFSTPHGGGGPGAGPVGVSERLVPFLPVPLIQKKDGKYTITRTGTDSIGQVRSFYGNTAILLRAYAYIRTYGNSIAAVAQTAVLNARYLRSCLLGLFEEVVPSDTLHEFVVATCTPAAGDQNAERLRAGDVGKLLLDYGSYAPTIYFPTTVREALMFEPTETESRRTLDQLAAACQAIVSLWEEDPDAVHSAPHSTPIDRVDEVLAARSPVLTWEQAKKHGLIAAQ